MAKTIYEIAKMFRDSITVTDVGREHRYSPDIVVYELETATTSKYALIKADYIYNDDEATEIITELFKGNNIEVIPPKTGVVDKGDEGILSAYFDDDATDQHGVYLLVKYD